MTPELSSPERMFGIIDAEGIMAHVDPATIAGIIDRAERIALRTEPELAALDRLTRRRRLASAVLRHLKRRVPLDPQGHPSGTSHLPRQG